MAITFWTPQDAAKVLSDDPADINTYIAHMAKPGGRYIHDIEIFPRAEQGNYSGDQTEIPEDVILHDTTESKLADLPIGLAETSIANIRINLSELKRISYDYMNKGNDLSDNSLYNYGVRLEELRQYLIHPSLFTDYTYDLTADGYSDIAGTYEIEVFNTFLISDNYDGEYTDGKDSATYGIWPVGLFSQGTDLSQKIGGDSFDNVSEFEMTDAAAFAIRNISYEDILWNIPDEQITNEYYQQKGIYANILNFQLIHQLYLTRNDKANFYTGSAYFTSLEDDAKAPYLIFLDIMQKFTVHNSYEIASNNDRFPTYDIHDWYKFPAAGGTSDYIGTGNPISVTEKISNPLTEMFILTREGMSFSAGPAGWFDPQTPDGYYYDHSGNSIYKYDNYYEYLRAKTESLGILGTAVHYSRKLTAAEPTKIYIDISDTPAGYGLEYDMGSFLPSQELAEISYFFLSKVISKFTGISAPATTDTESIVPDKLNGKTWNLEILFHNLMNNNFNDSSDDGADYTKYDRQEEKLNSMQMFYKHDAGARNGDWAAVPHPIVEIGTCEPYLNPDVNNGVSGDKLIRGRDFLQSGRFYRMENTKYTSNDHNDAKEPAHRSISWGLRVAHINNEGCYAQSLALMILSQFARINQTLIKGQQQEIKFGYTSNFVSKLVNLTDSNGTITDHGTDFTNDQHLLSAVTDWGNRTNEAEVFVKGSMPDDFYKNFEP